MKFKATPEQVRVMCAKAINASMPAGLGWLQYDSDSNVLPEELGRGSHDYDYVSGRMVKLDIRPAKDESDAWITNSFPPRQQWQSWAAVYPSTSLITECGGEILDD